MSTKATTQEDQKMSTKATTQEDQKMSTKATTQEEYLQKVSAATSRAQFHYPDSSAEAMSIRNSLRVLNILSEKTIQWLIENADKNSEMGTFFEQDMSWKRIVKRYLRIDL